MADGRSLNQLVADYKEASRNGDILELQQALNEIEEKLKSLGRGDITRITPDTIDIIVNDIMSANDDEIANEDSVKILRLAQFRRVASEHYERTAKIAEINDYRLMHGEEYKGVRAINRLQRNIEERERFYQGYLNEFFGEESHYPLDDRLIELMGSGYRSLERGERFEAPTQEDLKEIEELEDRLKNNSSTNREEDEKKLEEQKEKLGKYWEAILKMERYENLIKDLKEQLKDESLSPDEKQNILMKIGALQVKLQEATVEYSSVLNLISGRICEIVEDDIKKGRTLPNRERNARDAERENDRDAERENARDTERENASMRRENGQPIPRSSESASRFSSRNRKRYGYSC